MAAAALMKAMAPGHSRALPNPKKAARFPSRHRAMRIGRISIMINSPVNWAIGSTTTPS